MTRPTPAFAVESVDEGATVRVARVHGELDIANASRFRRLLERRVDVDLILDLSKLDFIDSSGLGALLRVRSALARNGSELMLVVPEAASVLSAFQVAGVLGELPISPDVPQARRRLASRSRAL